MEAFNRWLYEIQHSNAGRALYDSTGMVCMALLFIATLWYIWRQRMNPIKGIVIAFMAKYFMGYAQHLLTWYQRDFDLERYTGTANIGYALILIPLFCWLCDWAFNVQHGTSGELVAVSTMAWHWLGRSGCTFTGCCYGIPCSWGVYSDEVDANTFPVCWVESLLTLGILIFLLVRMFRRGYLQEKPHSRYRFFNWFYSKRREPDNGRALPYTLLIYGTGRFFTEFLRHQPEDKVLFGFLPEFSVMALIMALIGGGLLLHNIRKTAIAVGAADPKLPKIKAQRR